MGADGESTGYAVEELLKRVAHERWVMRLRYDSYAQAGDAPSGSWLGMLADQVGGACLLLTERVGRSDAIARDNLIGRLVRVAGVCDAWAETIGSPLLDQGMVQIAIYLRERRRVNDVRVLLGALNEVASREMGFEPYLQGLGAGVLALAHSIANGEGDPSWRSSAASSSAP